MDYTGGPNIITMVFIKKKEEGHRRTCEDRSKGLRWKVTVKGCGQSTEDGKSKETKISPRISSALLTP